jgi:ribosomal protein S18 acetylase RimI-like enzyme
LRVEPVRDPDLADLVPLLGDYCDFYNAYPGEARLRALAEHLIAHPGEGVQLIARADDGAALGFATVYWTWQTLVAARLGILHDLYVRPGRRGAGVGRALIEACREHARARGAVALEWDTAPDNTRAQALYDTTGARRSEWITYWLDA